METIPSKCLNCGGELWFNPKSRCLTCKYCESNYFLPEKKSRAIMVRQYDSAFHPNQLSTSLKGYKCNSCGNTYYMSSEKQTKRCPNCGNTSMSLVEDNGYAADTLIPFKITKEQAAKNFEEYLSHESDIPKNLKILAKEQKLLGVFVPVWNFTFNISADYSANVAEMKKDYNDMYYSVDKPIFGDKMKRIKSLDATATSTQDDSLLSLFDEDDYAGLIPFIPEYAYGYSVDSVDKDIHDYYYEIVEKAEKEMEASVKKELNSRYKYISNIDVFTRARDVFFNFAYVPVYVNQFEYKGKMYKTYVSGTTGKVAGNTPKSFASKFKKFIKTLLVIGGLGLLAFLLFK